MNKVDLNTCQQYMELIYKFLGGYKCPSLPNEFQHICENSFGYVIGSFEYLINKLDIDAEDPIAEKYIALFVGGIVHGIAVANLSNLPESNALLTSMEKMISNLGFDKENVPRGTN